MEKVRPRARIREIGVTVLAGTQMVSRKAFFLN